MDCAAYKPKERWDFALLAQPEEVATARRLVRERLSEWGFSELRDSAQLCVSELVSNVVTHVGLGTPISVTVSVTGSRLRIEVRDPDTRTLPVLVNAGVDAEAGRGMALVDALTERWGVQLCPDGKVTWCEFATGPTPHEREDEVRVARAADVLSFYGTSQLSGPSRRSRLGAMAAEAAAIDAITDLLHWLKSHGHDADEVLDRAQTRFEAQLDGVSGSR